MLCACSPYFESSLAGEWAESQTKTVEVTLESEQAVEDLKLLIKLCYSGSYTKEGGKLLDRTTRMRLAFLGNAFEMQDCKSCRRCDVERGACWMESIVKALRRSKFCQVVAIAAPSSHALALLVLSLTHHPHIQSTHTGIISHS